MAGGESRAYLRAYARGQQDQQPSRREDESVEAYAARIGADPGPKPSAAPSAAPASPQQDAGEDAPKDAPKDAGEPKDKPAFPPQGGSVRGGNPGKWADRVEDWRDRIAAAPTPGGSGAILLILILFVCLIVPVAQGYTRAQLLWLTLLGRTSLPSSGSPPEAASGPIIPRGSQPLNPTEAQDTAAAAARPAPRSPASAAASLVPLPMPGQQSFSMPPTVRG